MANTNLVVEVTETGRLNVGYRYFDNQGNTALHYAMVVRLPTPPAAPFVYDRLRSSPLKGPGRAG